MTAGDGSRLAPADWAHRTVLRTFSRLPGQVKRRVVGWLKPSYTLAAMCRLERPDGSMLVVRTSYRDGWVFPGGLCDRREGPAATAQREVAEEVGIEVELDARPITLVDPDMRRLDFVFHAAVPADVEVRPHPAEIAEYRWIGADAIPALEATERTSVGRVMRALQAGESLVEVHWDDIDGPVLLGELDALDGPDGPDGLDPPGLAD